MPRLFKENNTFKIKTMLKNLGFKPCAINELNNRFKRVEWSEVLKILDNFKMLLDYGFEIPKLQKIAFLSLGFSRVNYLAQYFHTLQTQSYTLEEIFIIASKPQSGHLALRSLSLLHPLLRDQGVEKKYIFRLARAVNGHITLDVLFYMISINNPLKYTVSELLTLINQNIHQGSITLRKLSFLHEKYLISQKIKFHELQQFSIDKQIFKNYIKIYLKNVTRFLTSFHSTSPISSDSHINFDALALDPELEEQIIKLQKDLFFDQHNGFFSQSDKNYNETGIEVPRHAL